MACDVWETDQFKSSDKIDKVRDKAVRHFVDQGSMSDDEYDLALVVDGVAQPPLNPDDRFRDAGVQDGSVLVLVPKRPQVDGQCTVIS